MRPGVLHPLALGPLVKVCPPERAPLDLVQGPEEQYLPLGSQVTFQMSLCFWDFRKVPGEVNCVSAGVFLGNSLSQHPLP